MPEFQILADDHRQRGRPFTWRLVDERGEIVATGEPCRTARQATEAVATLRYLASYADLRLANGDVITAGDIQDVQAPED